MDDPSADAHGFARSLILNMLRAGHVVIAAALALLVLGVVMVNSAGMEVARTPVTIESVLLSKSTIYMAMALTLMLSVASLFPARLIAAPPAALCRKLGGAPCTRFGGLWGCSYHPAPSSTATRNGFGGWGLWSMWLAVLFMLGVLAMVYVPGLGDARKGSSRWIGLKVGDLTLQPSEFAKWFLVALVAWYAVVAKQRIRCLWTGLLPILTAAAIVAGFVAIEDLGTAILLVCVAGVTTLAAGARFWHYLLPLPMALAGMYAMVKLEPYRMARIVAFIDPYAAPRTSGYHMIQSQVAITNGQFGGRGLGNGLQKFGYLPEDTTDFIFAIICEELGLIGAIVVVVLLCTLLLAGLVIVIKQRALPAKVLALGIVATVGIQAAINLLVVVGWAPTKGIALPLLSSGGTGWMLTASALGVLVALDRAASSEQLPAAVKASIAGPVPVAEPPTAEQPRTAAAIAT